MQNVLRKETISKIKEYNPDADIDKYECILKYCDILEHMEGICIEAFNCVIDSDDMISLKIGTYYAEISTNNHPIYDVMDNAVKARMYAVDIDNPDGAMFAVSMDFKI